MKPYLFRTFTIGMVIFMCVGFTACGDDENGDSPSFQVKLEDYSEGLYTDGVLIYRVLDSSSHKVQLVGTTDNEITSLSVPESVQIAGMRYLVTRIGRMHRWESDYEENDPWLFNEDDDEWMMEDNNEIMNNAETPIYYFNNCKNLKSINIPNSVTSIREESFENTPWYAAQPDGIVYVGKVAYRYKGALMEGESVSIKEGTLGIADYAFKDCDGMTDVTIPASINTIGYEAFCGCSLSGIYISDMAAWCNIDVQTDCGFGWDNTNPMYVCGHLYLNGEEIQGDIVLPATITGIATGAFYGIEGLTGVTLPPTVKRIGHWAFMNCSNLSQINLPSSLERIEHDAFKHCHSLTGITFPSSLRYIGLSAYEDCNNLTDIVIPAASIYFGERVFAYCYNLKDVMALSNTPETYDCDRDNIFKSCSSTATLHVLKGCWSMYYNTWPWSDFGTIVEDVQLMMAQAQAL